MKERDRRYNAVCQKMELQGLDVIVVWGNSAKWDSKMANVRYLTQIGGNGEEGFCLFPKKGDPIVYLWADMMVDEWLSAQKWVSDIRSSRPSWSASISNGIKDLIGEKGNVGIVGLGGYEAEGDMPFVTFQRVRETLPQCRFENATSILEGVRLIKSYEEIEMLERATILGDLATDVMYETVRPGVLESRVVGAMIEAIVGHGGKLQSCSFGEAGSRGVRRV